MKKLQELSTYQYHNFVTKLMKEKCLEIREPFLLEEGNVYIGEWDVDTGERTGRGKILFKNGSLFEGTFHKNKVNGHGRLIKEDGEMYTGDWKNDMYHGEGTLTCTNGSNYKGNWEDDK
jgi:hypothetical protein